MGRRGAGLGEPRGRSRREVCATRVLPSVSRNCALTPPWRCENRFPSVVWHRRAQPWFKKSSFVEARAVFVQERRLKLFFLANHSTSTQRGSAVNCEENALQTRSSEQARLAPRENGHILKHALLRQSQTALRTRISQRREGSATECPKSRFHAFRA